MSDTMHTCRERLSESLSAANNKDLVVAQLAYFLSMSFRGLYVQAEASEAELRLMRKRMRDANEILHVLAEQALMYKGAGAGYPEDALVQVIVELAEDGDLVHELEWSCQQAMPERSS